MNPRIVNGTRCAVCGNEKAEGRSYCLDCGEPVERAKRMERYQRRRVAFALRNRICPGCFEDFPGAHADGCAVALVMAQRENPTAKENHDALVEAGLRSRGGAHDRDGDYELNQQGHRYGGGDE